MLLKESRKTPNGRNSDNKRFLISGYFLSIHLNFFYLLSFRYLALLNDRQLILISHSFSEWFLYPYDRNKWQANVLSGWAVAITDVQRVFDIGWWDFFWLRIPSFLLDLIILHLRHLNLLFLFVGCHCQWTALVYLGYRIAYLLFAHFLWFAALLWLVCFLQLQHLFLKLF